MFLRNLIFDLDGTLIDSLPGIEFSVDAALSEHHLAPRSSGLKTLIGPPIRTILGTIAGADQAAHLPGLEHAFRQSYDSAGWRKTLLFEGARGILEKARGVGTRMFIATNKPAKVTGLILDHLQIRSFFEDVVCRDSVQPPYSSKAVMLISLTERYGFQKDDSLFIGDTSEDFEAGIAAGLNTAIVAHGYGDAGLTRHPDYFRLNRFEELQLHKG